MSCGVGCRRGSDPALLWLWRRPVATAPIRPLAWEPPYASGAAHEIAKRQKKKKKKKKKKDSPKPRASFPAVSHCVILTGPLTVSQDTHQSPPPSLCPG